MLTRIVCVAALVAFCAFGITGDQVVQLAASGISQETVIAAINSQTAEYDLAAVLKLIESKRISPQVGEAMIKRLNSSAPAPQAALPPQAMDLAAAAASGCVPGLTLTIYAGGGTFPLDCQFVSQEMGSGIGTMMTGGGLLRKIKVNFLIPGEASVSEVPVAKAASMHIDIIGATVHPSTTRFVRLIPYKDRRIAYVKEGKLTMNQMKGENLIEVKVEKLPNGLRVIPLAPLEPGGYGLFSTQSPNHIWTFDVVEPTKVSSR